MQRKSSILAIAMALLVAGLWLSAGTRANEEPAVELPKAEALPTLKVTVKSLSGGNFSSYSVPSEGTTGTLDFKALSTPAEHVEPIKFRKEPSNPEEFKDWYIPVPGPMRVDALSNKFGRQQVRLVGEGLGDGRLRIELDYFKDHPEVVRVWFILEYKGFIDSVAYGEAPLGGRSSRIRHPSKECY